MGINQTLLREIEPFLSKYDCEEHDVQTVLNPPNIFVRYLYPRNNLEKRRTGVVQTISAIMEPHGKRHLFEHVSQLQRVEGGMQLLVPHHRDHVIHALLCFLLGIYINEKFIPRHQAQTIDEFQWEIASLFHDIGYPIEMAYKAILGPYFDTIKGNAAARQPFPTWLCQLSGGRSTLTLIQSQITRWGLKVDVEAEFQKMFIPKGVNHGIISALTILKRIDTLYNEKNPNRNYGPKLSDDGVDWNQVYFDEDIVPACSAIFTHGLNKENFVGAKIRLSRAPLAFLLKLTDCLQEWDRPGRGGHSFPADRFDIEVKEKLLILNAQIPDTTKTRMRSEIEDYLEDPNVEIR